jgi:hypothetical protein
MNCCLQKQSIDETMKILIDFLSEFLLFLSSIIQFQSSGKLVDIAERIHQLRSALLLQINHPNNDLKNSSTFDISSICSILHELASFIRSLCNEQEHFGAINVLTQLSDRLEKLISSCMNSHSQVGQHFLCIHYK